MSPPARSGTTDDDFDRLVGDLRRLGDDELLLAWKGVREALGEPQPEFAKGHRLRFRHYAFRKVAAERFGAEGHVARYRAVAGR